MDEETIVFGESPVTPSKSSRTRVRGKAIPQLEDITENDAVISKPSPATPTRRARLRHTSLMEEIESPNEKATPQRVTRQRRGSLLQDIVEKDTGPTVDASPRALRAAKRRESKENEVLTPARRSRRVSSARLSVDSSSPGGTVRKSPRLFKLVSPVLNTSHPVSSQNDMSEDTKLDKSTNKTSDIKNSSIKSSDINNQGNEDTVDPKTKNGIEDGDRHDKKDKTKKEKRKSLPIGMGDDKEEKLYFGKNYNTQDNDHVLNVDKTLKAKTNDPETAVKARNSKFSRSQNNTSSLSSSNISSTRSRTASLNVSKSNNSKIDNFFSDNEARRKSATANLNSSKSKSSKKSKVNKSDTNLNKCLDESFAKILKEKTFSAKIDLKSKDQQEDTSEKQTEVIIQELMVPIEGKVISSIQISDTEFPTQADNKQDFEESNFSTEDQLVPVVSQESAANKSTDNYISDENSNTLRKSKRISQKLSGNNIFSPTRDYTDNREIEPMDVDITRTNSVIYDSKHNQSKIDTTSISCNKDIGQFSNNSGNNIHLETRHSDIGNDNCQLEDEKQKKDISNNSENSNCQSKSTFILSVNKSNDDSIEKSSQIKSKKSITPMKLSSNDSTHGKTNYTKLKEIATSSPIVQGMMTTSTPVDVTGKRKNKKNTKESLVGSTTDKLPNDELEERLELKSEEAPKTLPKSTSEFSTKRTDILDATTLNKSKSEMNLESSSSDTESSENIFLDKDAIDAGDDYQSGDSMNSSSRNENELNEIPVKGVSLNSEDTVSNNSDSSEYEKDSFVVSTDDDEEGMSESDELTQSDLDLNMSSKSKAKYNRRKIREQKKASREMFEARHGVQQRNKSKLNESTSESERDETDELKQTKRKARMRIESTMDTSNEESEITIQNVSFKKDPLSLSKIKQEDVSIADATMIGNSENINNNQNISVICDKDNGTNEQDDKSLSENEEIANDYASLLEKLRNTSKQQSLKKRKSLSALQNKEKTPKNKVLEELNITNVKNIPKNIKSNQTGPKILTGNLKDATMTEISDVEMESVDSETSIKKHSESSTTNMAVTPTINLVEKLQTSSDSLNRKTVTIESSSFQKKAPQAHKKNEDEPCILPNETNSQSEISTREEGKERKKRSNDSEMKRQPKHNKVTQCKEHEVSEQCNSDISSTSKQENLDKNCSFLRLSKKDITLETPASALKFEHKGKSRKNGTDKQLLEIDDITAFGTESENPQNPGPVPCIQAGTRNSKKSKPLTEHKKKGLVIEDKELPEEKATNEKYLFVNKHDPMTESIRDDKRNKAKKRKSFEDVQPTNAHEILRLPAELVAQLQDEPKPKKRKQTSTSDFVVENIYKSDKPSHYLEESVHIEFSKKKHSVNKTKTKKKGTVSKILPSVPNATTSGSGFTTNFKVCVLNETNKSAVKAYDFSSFKNERFNKLKRTEASGYVNKFRF